MLSTARPSALASLGAFVLACASPATETTVEDGRVLQSSHRVRWPDAAALDVFVVVNTDATVSGVQARRTTRVALRRMSDRLAASRRDRWKPIDIRLFVMGGFGEPPEAPTFTWREADVTPGGAAAFSEASERAIDAVPWGASGANVVARVDAAIERWRRRERVLTTILVATTVDDDSASADAPSELGHEDRVTLLLPPDPSERAFCAPARNLAPKLSAWTRARDGDVSASCDDVRLEDSQQESTSCFTGYPGRATDCSVHVRLPVGSTCDRERGWRRDARRADEDEGTTCEVVALDGDDGALCRDLSQPYRGRSSGQCLPVATALCLAPAPRIVGGAAPPGSVIELTCNWATR